MQHSSSGTVAPVQVDYVGQKNNNPADGYDVSIAYTDGEAGDGDTT